MLELLLWLGGGYAVLAGLVYLWQPNLVYFPIRTAEHRQHPGALGMDHQDVWLTTEDGVRVHGWYLTDPGARRVALFFHGNAGNISHRLETLATLRRLGLAVLIIDYRGYGRSEGRPDERGTYADAAAAWAFLTGPAGWSPSQILLWGRSLGGAVAIWLAANERPGALVVESSFSSLVDLGAEVYPWLPVRWLSRFRYPSRSLLVRVDCPVLIVHSSDDEIIPHHHGLALYEAAREPKQLLTIRGPHNSAVLIDRANYQAGLQAFLDTLETRGATPDQ